MRTSGRLIKSMPATGRRNWINDAFKGIAGYDLTGTGDCPTARQKFLVWSQGPFAFIVQFVKCSATIRQPFCNDLFHRQGGLPISSRR